MLTLREATAKATFAPVAARVMQADGKLSREWNSHSVVAHDPVVSWTIVPHRPTLPLPCCLNDLVTNRYLMLENTLSARKPEKSEQENIDAWGSYNPGYPYRPHVDMEPHIPDSCPNKAKVGAIFTAARCRKVQ